MKAENERNRKEFYFSLNTPLNKYGQIIVGNNTKLESNVKDKIEIGSIDSILEKEFYYTGDSLIIGKIDDYIKVLKHFKGDLYIPCERIYLGMVTDEQIRNILTTLDKKSVEQIKHWLDDFNSIVDVSPKYSIYELHKIIDDINYLDSI